MGDLSRLVERINLVDADRVHRQAMRWKPLPHQVPPGSDFSGWLLLAGRGAGKTDACARYITDHVNGPPCLPGPVPHWIGIIAPTLGDAATSCFYGPSGIRAHSPDARLINGLGGATVRWPNGSEAKLFGAHTPEDVERLRSGGNRCATWCCSKGTMIRTSSGQVPIENVRVGDLVWTRAGLRRVSAAALTRRNAETLIIRTSEGHRLELTPDHRVWVVGRGWVEAQNVTPGCRMLAWNHLQQGHPRGTTGKAFVGAGILRGTTRIAWASSSTVRCGRRMSGLWTAIRSSIIKIMTNRTMISATCNPSRMPNTGSCTQKSGKTLHGSPLSPRKLPVAVPTISGSSGSSMKSHALPAELSSNPQECGPSSAEAPAVRETSVLVVEPSSTRPDTYDLTIEGEPEFFANDLVVHNCEELSAWRYLDNCWSHMRFGLRTGPRPHWVASTTPKPRALIKKLASGRSRGVEVTRASTFDNPHLPQDIKDALEEEYGGTQLGRQELNAEILDQDENALWTHDMLDVSRLAPDAVPDMIRRSVGVDPSGGVGEQGIVVVGKAMIPREHEDPRKRSPLAHGYVLADRTVHLPPDGWGRRAVQAAVDYEADDICVEINYGGDMAVSTIRSAADAMGVNVPIRVVRASRGKRVRAEPVSALTEQGRWHMVGTHSELEAQMCTWFPELDWSPDRLDASVWPAHHMRIVKMAMTGNSSPTGLATANRKIG